MNIKGIEFTKQINIQWAELKKDKRAIVRHLISKIENIQPGDSLLVERMMRLGLEGLAITTYKEDILRQFKTI
jgi:hypothetical protein